MNGKNFSAILCAMLFSVALSACNKAAPEAPKAEAASATAPAKIDLVAVQKEIDTAYVAMSDLLAKGDAAGVANLYTADAHMLEYDAPTHVGRASIQEAFAGFAKSGATKLSLKTVAIWGAGDGVVEEGSFIFAMTDGKEIAKGKYLVLWKQEGGKWKLFRDCFNADAPAAPAAPAPSKSKVPA
jgi:uncharacterized protein (TIGR02246 family)